MENLLEKVVNLSKRRGFVFQGSDIYGGLANTWDYGPLGVELKNNIRDMWWKRFVKDRDDMVGIDAAVLMNPMVWEASGHVINFNDIQVDCKQCKTRHRADHLIENSLEGIKVEGLGEKELSKLIKKYDIVCPNCGAKNFTDARKFNLLFKTSIGALEKDANTVYLRGELAQSMFTNFKTVLETTRKKLPFGIAQIGKVFRNEITPGNFIFRTLEFDLMEFEYFVRPKDAEKTFFYWQKEMMDWCQKDLGLDRNKLRIREHSKEELSHYSSRTIDIEYHTPFGWKELYGLANRTDFDLKNHSQKSGIDLRYTDADTGEKFFPYTIEPTFGLTRSVLMVLLDSYKEIKGGRTTTTESKKETEVLLRLPKHLAPIKIAVLPLSKKDKLIKEAKKVFDILRKQYVCEYDETQSIGRRYRRQDEIGTPFCVTVDFDSLEDKKVTVRDRDTMKQDRVAIKELLNYFSEKF